MSATRFETKETVQLQIYGKSGEVLLHMRNVSKSGACLECSPSRVPLKKGDLVRMIVELPEVSKKHKVSGEVIWCDGHRTGITFLSKQKVIQKIMGRSAF